MWPRIADPLSRTPFSTTATHILEPDSLQHRYIVRPQKHPLLQQGYTSDSETPHDTFYELEPLSLQQGYISNSETPLFTARTHPMI